MKRHTCARGLLVGAMSVIALGASTGVAQAQPELPEPNPQPAPGTAPAPGPMTVPAADLHKYLGVRTVDYVASKGAPALIDSTLVA